jgi:hypothetical protein
MPERRSEPSGVAYQLAGNGDVLRLHTEVGQYCGQVHAQARRATYTYRPHVERHPELSGTVVEGCYIIRDGMVYMVFADNDKPVLPLSEFSKPGEQVGSRAI